MKSEKNIWLISDGKPGHENQSRGLIHALSELMPLQQQLISIPSTQATWLDYALGRLPKKLRKLPAPDLIIGTGSRTHSTLLAVGRATQARTIVIMAPPRWLSGRFDLCVLPRHDDRKGKNVIRTLGAMNRVRPAATKKPASGLFLIGGPSKHHTWNEAQLIQQIQEIIAAQPTTRWQLTTSRRTPPATTEKLQELASPQLEVIPAERTPPEWLPAQLAETEQAWVTEDSVSMIYEALSADAKVGLLTVPRKSSNSRVIRGLDHLIQEKWIAPYDSARPDLSQFKKPPPLNEAERIAYRITERWY
jgi:mitochondrial fission protein ELM1